MYVVVAADVAASVAGAFGRTLAAFRSQGGGMLIEKYLSPSEAARELGISSERVRQLVREGRLAAVMTPLGRLISPEAVTAFAEQRRLARETPAAVA